MPGRFPIQRWPLSTRSKSEGLKPFAERRSGDRRGFVAVDCQEEIYAIAKWTGVKTKQVRNRLGDENALPNVEDVKKQIAQEMLPVIHRLSNKLDAQRQERQSQFEKRRQELITRQRAERRSLNDRLVLSQHCFVV